MERRRRQLLTAMGGRGCFLTAGCLSVLDRGASGGSIGDRDPTPYTSGTVAWPRDGFDAANTGYNPDGTLRSNDLDASRLTDGGSGIAAREGGAVAVADERLYFGTQTGDVVCYTVDGTQLWTYEADPNAGVRSIPSLTREVVYVTSDNGTYALAADDGEELWTSDAWIRRGSSVVANGNVYAIEPGPKVVALDVETGEQRWQAESRPTHALAVVDGAVYTTGTGSDGSVVSAIRDGGDLSWIRDDMESIHSAPVVTDEIVLVCTDRGHLIALDRRDGERVWAYDREIGPSTRPAVAHGKVYLPAGNGSRTRCLDLETGEKLWTVRTDVYSTQPTAVGDGVYFGTPNDGLFAVSPDGERRWHDERWRIDGPITAVGERLYVVPFAGPFESGDLYALSSD